VDIESLLRSLNAHEVEYVVIGATAFPIHGYARATLDIDLFIRAETPNADRLLKGLRDFGYDVQDLTAEDLLTKKVLIRQYLVETDLHPYVAGVTSRFGQIGSRASMGTNLSSMPPSMTLSL
jgi:hypothetical protein